jgi:hypothetical protein
MYVLLCNWLYLHRLCDIYDEKVRHCPEKKFKQRNETFVLVVYKWAWMTILVCRRFFVLKYDTKPWPDSIWRPICSQAETITGRYRKKINPCRRERISSRILLSALKIVGLPEGSFLNGFSCLRQKLAPTPMLDLALFAPPKMAPRR